ncbi:MAG TPA: CPBP family intramembrane glutamic endopeptidase [Burkholderiaceae bacterium]
MPDLLLTTLPKVLLPAVAIAIMLIAAHKRGLSLSTDLGLARPRPKAAALFLLLWLCLMALEELVTPMLEGAQAKAWPAYPGYIVALRVLAIGLLGPIAEELAFRGLLMRLLGRTRLGLAGAIVVTAALWAAIHVQYAPALLLMIFVDGIVLGLARHFTASLYVPMAMHVLGNLFSIYQSLTH